MTTHHLVLAAPGLDGGRLFGAVTYSALAAVAAICLVSGMRGSKKVRIKDDPDKVGALAIVTGTLCVAAGGTWQDFAQAFGDNASSSFTQSGLGEFGQGGISLVLTALTFVPDWKKKIIIPAVLGIAAAVTFHTAGGSWGLIINLILTPARMITGNA
ncbi:hypothetical protein [Streptomyces sp. NPDC056987]|uniref:hypothetical protein n=1 Tax=Streptomyces sp. NPDC056987 TaxID=3345988 RepID=UPI0036313FC0